MKRYIFLSIIAIFVGLSPVRAQQSAYNSKLLEELGKSIGYVPNDTCTAGVYSAGMVLGKPLIVEYDTRHVITHLGFRLFSEEMKKTFASDVYNFLERYFLEIYCWKNKATSLEQKLSDDKVMFTKGSIAVLGHVDENTPFSINKVENKYYQVAWSENGEPILELAFPIQYELLLGMPQAEIEKTMYDLIVSAPNAESTLEPVEMELVKDSVYRTVPMQYYQLEDLNTCMYYYKKDEAATLVLDTLNIDLSALNILHAITTCNNPIKVEQSLYGFNKVEYIITLRQWLNYCKSAGLTIYTATEEEYEDAFKILVVAESKDLGYNHLLSVVVPRNFLIKASAPFLVKMNAFIPTHNVKNLYQQYTTSTKKKVY